MISQVSNSIVSLWEQPTRKLNPPPTLDHWAYEQCGRVIRRLILREDIYRVIVWSMDDSEALSCHARYQDENIVFFSLSFPTLLLLFLHRILLRWRCVRTPSFELGADADFQTNINSSRPAGDGEGLATLSGLISPIPWQAIILDGTQKKTKKNTHTHTERIRMKITKITRESP